MLKEKVEDITKVVVNECPRCFLKHIGYIGEKTRCPLCNEKFELKKKFDITNINKINLI